MNILNHLRQFHLCQITKTLYQRLKKKGIMNNHYLLVYNYINNDNNIYVEEYGYEPLIYKNMCGFLITDKDIKFTDSELNNIENRDFEYPHVGDVNVIQSNYLGNYFEKGDDIVIKLSPIYGAYPNFIKSYIKKYSYENFKNAIKDKDFVKKIFDKYKEINESSPKNFEELIEYIKYNNPYEVFFIPEINDESFKHEFNYLEIMIFYDIRHKDEIDIAYEIESKFIEKKKDLLTFAIHNNVNDIVTKIENEFKRLGITDYEVICLEPPNKNKFQMKKIISTYANFDKCNIEYDALDYY